MKRATRTSGYELLDGEEVRAYVFQLFPEEDSRLRRIRERQEFAGIRPIQLSPADARHLSTFVKAHSPQKIVEFGTLCGYSGVAMLLAAPESAHLDTFEIDPRHAALAQESFAEAGLTDRVTIHRGDARLNLINLQNGPYDLCFIDGGFELYPVYLQWATENLRVGGILIADNVYHFGKVADPSASSPSTAAVRAFNETLLRSEHWHSTIIPTGEGLCYAVKRA